LAVFKGNQFAKAGLETAWWVLEAKRLGLPLHRLLGGTAATVSVGADFGVQDSIDVLLAKIQGAIEQGFPRVKLKFRPGWDLNMLEAVRSSFPNFTFHIDCNAGYALADVDLFRKIDRFHLAMIEQPLQADDLVDHAVLQKAIETPICLDESIHSLHDAEVALRLGSCRIVNIKMGRVGGLGVARAIHDLCAQHGVPCWVGSMLESSLGAGICVELATLPNFTYPADIFPARHLFSQDIVSPEVALSGPGVMTASAVSGIPYEPVPELLELRTIQRASHRL
jgi:O-succinylbenzoate synthase